MVNGSVVLEVEGAGLCKKHSSLPPARRRRLKGCNSSLYHCFFLPYDGNGAGRGGASIPAKNHRIQGDNFYTSKGGNPHPKTFPNKLSLKRWRRQGDLGRRWRMGSTRTKRSMQSSPAFIGDSGG